MKFKNFLIEEKITDENLKQIIQHVDDSYLNHVLNINGIDDAEECFIYRGGQNHGEISIRNHPLNRISANTTNECTILLDNFLPSWKNYPKRSESFICSTSSDTAENYGDVYFVIPMENKKIGVCPDLDIWYSFENVTELIGVGGSQVPDTNEALQIIRDAMKLEKKEKKEISKYDYPEPDGMNTKKEINKFIDNVNSFLNDKTKLKLLLDSLDELEKKGTNNAGYSLALIKKASKDKNFIKTLDDLLNPEANNFKLLTKTQLLDKKYFDKEVWFSSKAAFINISYFHVFQDKLKKLRK